MTIYTCMISIYIYKGQKLIKDNYLRLRDVPTLIRGRTLSISKQAIACNKVSCQWGMFGWVDERVLI